MAIELICCNRNLLAAAPETFPRSEAKKNSQPAELLASSKCSDTPQEMGSHSRRFRRKIKNIQEWLAKSEIWLNQLKNTAQCQRVQQKEPANTARHRALICQKNFRSVQFCTRFTRVTSNVTTSSLMCSWVLVFKCINKSGAEVQS